MERGCDGLEASDAGQGKDRSNYNMKDKLEKDGAEQKVRGPGMAQLASAPVTPHTQPSFLPTFPRVDRTRICIIPHSI